MPAPQVSRQVDFSKGIYANVNRYGQPPGTVRRCSNYIFSRDGALVTTDGSRILCSQGGAGPVTNSFPWRWLGRYAAAAQPTYLYGLQASGANVSMIDITGTSWAAPDLTFASAYQLPSFIQVGDFLAVALGAGVTPGLLHQHPLVTVPWTNTWNAATNIPVWFANVGVDPGQSVQPTTANGHIYIAIQDTVGVTGATQPTFPTTPAGQTVTDGTVVWQEAGTTGPPMPPGADFFFFHAGFLWAWGTKQSYDNLDGPDALRMSDLYNFTSWNPLNATYIGKGDGTKPTGGGTLTLSESGIEATNQLVLFKQTSTYVVLGVLGPGASAKRAPTGVGCVAPHTVQFIEELGMMRLSQRGVAVFDGQNDVVEQYTAPIKSYLFGGMKEITPVDWANVQFSFGARVHEPPAYVLACPLPGSTTVISGIDYPPPGAVSHTINFPYTLPPTGVVLQITTSWNTQWWISAITTTNFTIMFNTPAPAGAAVYWASPITTAGGCTRMFVYHLTLQAWSVVDLPWPISALAYIPENTYPNYTLSGGTTDGTIRRLFAGDPDWDGTPILTSVSFPEIGNPVTPSYIKEVAISSRANSPYQCGFTGASLSWLDRDGIYHTDGLYVAPNQVPVHVGIDKTLVSALLTLTGMGRILLEGLEIPVQPKRYSKWRINRDGGNTTLDPPGSAGVQSVPLSTQTILSIGAGETAVNYALPVMLTSSQYMPTVSPNWNTSWWLSQQDPTQIAIQFNTPAPPGGGSAMVSIQTKTPQNDIGQVLVPAGSPFIDVLFDQPVQVAYTPIVSVSWNTTYYVMTMNPTGMRILFGSSAPPGGGLVNFQPVHN